MKNFIEYINLNPKIKIFLILFGLTNIISIIYYFLGRNDISIHLSSIIYTLCFYMLFNSRKLKNFSYLLFIIPIILILSALIFESGSYGYPISILYPLSFIGSNLIYILISLITISIVNIYNKNSIYLNIIFSFLMIMLINISQVYSVHDSYNNGEVISMYSDKVPCLVDVFDNRKAFHRLYSYHTPKSNLFLPTLGIRYKENYKEERGIVVVYEKHSYFNLYVGDGKVLCENDGGLETLE